MERAAVPGNLHEERLRRWIDAYAGAVMKTCYAYLLDRALAEDAMQDTFLKAWKHMEAFDRKGIENEKAWLMRIAIHTCIDYKRSSWFRHVDRRHTPDTLPEHLLQAGVQQDALILEISRLPDKYRRVVLLYFYQGCTLTETADALGITKSSAHRRIEKAKEMLKSCLGGDDREG